MDAKVKRPRWADVGQRLEIAMKLMGFEERRAFREHFNVNESTLSMWISGKSRINLDDALRVCEESGLTLDYLYQGNMDGLPHGLARKIMQLS